ncbi:transmembrane protein 26-like [Glandiceps talaboti]
MKKEVFAVIVKASFGRLIYLIHGMLAVWRVTVMKSDPTYWALSTPLFLMFIEGVITLKLTCGEWKWFSPSTLLYLTCVIPSVWVMEEEFISRRNIQREESGFDGCDISNANITHVSNLPLTDVEISDEAAVLAIHQMLLFLLVLGRWLMPAGNVSKDQLSQLLLVYIGMAADILEFATEGVKEPSVKCSIALLYAVLGLWAWSLLQFTLLYPAADNASDEERKTLKCSFNTEMWEIATTSIMQDLPFLIMRLFLLIKYDSINQMMIFFICKNILVLMLHIYRMAVILLHVKDNNTDVVPLAEKVSPDDNENVKGGENNIA